MTSNKESSPSSSNNSKKHRVLALYKFVKIETEKVPELQKEIECKLRSVKARGTILIACEGINGTICYPEESSVQINKDNGSDNDPGGKEGNNGSSCNDAYDVVINYFQSHEYFNGLRTRLSYVDTSIFHRLKVKIKKEIVTMTGDDDDQQHNHDVHDVVEENTKNAKDSTNDNNENPKKKTNQEKIKVDPTEVVGTYVNPGKEWDDLLMDPDVVVIDTRNKYEYDIGTFENAISPNTDNFRQFPDWLHRFSNACDNLNDAENDNQEQCVINDKLETNTNPRSRDPILSLPKINRKPKAVAMFCTGGIRCEKSTSYALASQVFDKDVPIYHLDGGILAYLDHNRDPNKSKWNGECFVFDQRVALTHGLKPSESYNACHGCKRPLSEEDKSHKDYLYGVHCKHCKETLSEKQIQRFQSRQKQIELAEQKGTTHFCDPKEASSI